MSRTLAGYLESRSRVVHARDLQLDRVTDIDWINFLRDSGEEWTVVTGDTRIRKNRAEREAFRRARLRGVVLSPAFQKTEMGRCCGMLVARWDDLMTFTSSIQPPYLVEVALNLGSRYKVLPL
jgi:hypothetical protein